MLVLTRKAGQEIIIDDTIRVMVTSVGDGRVKLGISAPPHIKVDRAMLHHPQAAAELDLVMRVARDPIEQGTAQLGRVVVVEGVDHEMV